jgi:hypothetical protein
MEHDCILYRFPGRFNISGVEGLLFFSERNKSIFMKLFAIKQKSFFDSTTFEYMYIKVVRSKKS